MSKNDKETISLDELNTARAELAQTQEAKKHFERAKGKGLNALALTLFLDTAVVITGNVSAGALVPCVGLTAVAGIYYALSAYQAGEMDVHAEKLRAMIDRYSLKPR